MSNLPIFIVYFIASAFIVLLGAWGYKATLRDQGGLMSAHAADVTELPTISQHVLYNDGTEQPFSSPLNNEHRDGWYVDIVTGDQLFRSEHKYDSGTGWPSFFEVSGMVTREPELLPWRGVEIRSADGERHYGHVFTDGPAPTGLRYCMNGAALKFIPDSDSDE